MNRRRWFRIQLTIFTSALALVVVVVTRFHGSIMQFIQLAAHDPASFVADPVDAPTAASVQDIVVHSEILHRDLPAHVYLPAGSPSATRHLATIYFLHGTPGGYSDWLDLGNAKTILDDAIAHGDIPPVAAVFPEVDDQPNAATEYVNRRDGTYPIMDYLTTELPATVERQFHLAASPRAIVGLSEGGYGAANIAIRHPGVFGYAASLSGYFVARDIPDNSFAFGHDAAYARVNSPLYWISDQPTVKLPKLYLAAEQGDEYDQELQTFAAKLKELNIPAEVHFAPGTHDWPLWQAQLPDVLRWLGRYWTK